MAYIKKIYRKLTKEQKKRGVCYSSALVCKNFYDAEEDTIHEVKYDDPKREETIERLQDITFFDRMAEDCGWDVVCVIRQ